MLKLAALGALGYAGYKYYEKNKARQGGTAEAPLVAQSDRANETPRQSTAVPI